MLNKMFTWLVKQKRPAFKTQGRGFERIFNVDKTFNKMLKQLERVTTRNVLQRKCSIRVSW